MRHSSLVENVERQLDSISFLQKDVVNYCTLWCNNCLNNTTYNSRWSESLLSFFVSIFLFFFFMQFSCNIYFRNDQTNFCKYSNQKETQSLEFGVNYEHIHVLRICVDRKKELWALHVQILIVLVSLLTVLTWKYIGCFCLIYKCNTWITRKSYGCSYHCKIL